MNSLDALQLVAFAIGAAWFLTGTAIWLRWGWCGVRWIWRKRIQIDAAVQDEMDAPGAALEATEPLEEYRNG